MILTYISLIGTYFRLQYVRAAANSLQKAQVRVIKPKVSGVLKTGRILSKQNV